ncbi:hypothetical protein KSP35_08810 [Aquihabitans sp. G128]|uniref:hypothetical protein n=1 Tax=Aquihabitans sp. G128 TaxID=2849779 RepID=UPI001C23AE46|nr:hypothetical protein [Aquihabitans sp. G128]QXC62863.1 hypothetical protein KSP35_08810 [Aquihabitans sp. G128]
MQPLTATDDRIVADLAADILGPLGFTAFGYQRFWLADHGWWAQTVGLHRPDHGEGLVANVGWVHLWDQLEHFGFYGLEPVHWPDGRLVNVAWTPDEPHAFEARVEGAVILAAELAQAQSDAHADGTRGLRSVAGQRRINEWATYDAGVAEALLGRRARARQSLQEVVRLCSRPGGEHIDWVGRLRLDAADLLERLPQSASLRWELNRRIALTRERKGLRAVDPIW